MKFLFLKSWRMKNKRFENKQQEVFKYFVNQQIKLQSKIKNLEEAKVAKRNAEEEKIQVKNNLQNTQNPINKNENKPQSVQIELKFLHALKEKIKQMKL